MPDTTDVAAFEGFLLGLRVMYQLYEIDAPASDFQKPWEILKEISAGELTLTNPGDLAARHPGLSTFLFDRANQIVAGDRLTARAILEGLQTALGGLPESGPRSTM